MRFWVTLFCSIFTSYGVQAITLDDIISDAFSSSLIVVDLGTEYESHPTVGSNEEIRVVYPANVGQATINTVSAYIVVDPSGPNSCVDCSPFTNNLANFTVVMPLEDPESFTYGVLESFAGLGMSYFILATAPDPFNPSEILAMGVSDIKNLYFSESSSYPIAFVSGPPNPNGFVSMYSPFGNQDPFQTYAGRGGDLWIKYPDGELKNMTAAAGYGVSGFQGSDAIQVRDPSPSWNGDMLVFSMIEGGLEGYCLNNCPEHRWQVYVMTNIGQNQTPTIHKVPNQPESYNNISPIFGLEDGEIYFVSDKVRDGFEHHYPYLDEYENEATTAGVFRLNFLTGELLHLDDSPSGAQNLYFGSEGQILFTRWDHLERDQNIDLGAYVFPDESAEDFALATPHEEYLEPEFPEASLDSYIDTNDPIWGVNHIFKRFIFWEMNPDGTALETLRHYGRHEFTGYFSSAYSSNLHSGITPHSSSDAVHVVENFYSISEDPNETGRFYFVDAPDMHTQQAGHIVEMIAPKGTSPTQFQYRNITNPSMQNGRFRDVRKLSDGSLIAAWTPDSGYISGNNLNANYSFRIVRLQQDGQFFGASEFLTEGIKKPVSYYKQDSGVGSLISMSGNVNHWETMPIEVRPRQKPKPPENNLEAPESTIMAETGTDVESLKAWMKERDLALIVSRDVTTRDRDDKQQAFNLRVKNTNTQTVGNSGGVVDVSHLQVWQGDRTKGYWDGDYPTKGRRIMAKPLHDEASVAANLPSVGPEGSVPLGDDGSFAMFVPAGRALSWQLTDEAEPIIRERYWVTFQAGEIRVCASCHGINDEDQAGGGVPQNQPEALRDLMQHWQQVSMN